MLLTKSNWIFRHFRTLLIELLFRTFRLVRDSYPPTSNQTDNRAYDVCVGNSRSLQYFEFSCWIDGITLATVEEFGKLLLDASNCSSPLVVDVARAWQNQKVPAPLPSFKQSKVLVRALQRLGQASAEFRLLILQTVERCLLRDPSPLPMATLIVEFAENESLLMNDQMRYLLHYAKSLILFESFTGSDRRLALVQMLQSTFSKEFFPLSLLICNGCPRSKFALGREDCLDVSWQLTNFSLLLQGGDSARCMAFLRRILPITLMVRCLHVCYY